MQESLGICLLGICYFGKPLSNYMVQMSSILAPQMHYIFHRLYHAVLAIYIRNVVVTDPTVFYLEI